MNEVYLDNSSTTRVCETAAAKVMELMTENYGNPSSLHALGFRAEQAMTQARRSVAAALGTKEEEVFFTSGGTESNNLAIFGAAYARKRMGMHIVTTQIEHPSVANAVRQLEKEGWEITRLISDASGCVSAAALEAALRPDTVLVSMMMVNNETGAIFPVEEAAPLIRRLAPGALLHCDAVQAFGKLPIRTSRLDVDMLTVSGHKIHAPKGCGALYVKKGVRILPRAFGGGQEKGLRPGTEATPAIAAFGAAADAVPDLNTQRIRFESLMDRLLAGLKKQEGIIVHRPARHAPYILNLSVPGIRSETLLHFLAQREIYVSSGSACSRGKSSPVLAALGLPSVEIDSAVRVSFSRDNDEEDIDRFLTGLEEARTSLARRESRPCRRKRRSL